jgi:hypothetical protein
MTVRYGPGSREKFQLQGSDLGFHEQLRWLQCFRGFLNLGSKGTNRRVTSKGYTKRWSKYDQSQTYLFSIGACPHSHPCGIPPADALNDGADLVS